MLTIILPYIICLTTFPNKKLYKEIYNKIHTQRRTKVKRSEYLEERGKKFKKN